MAKTVPEKSNAQKTRNRSDRPAAAKASSPDEARLIAGLRGASTAVRALRGVTDWNALAEAVPRELCAHTDIERSVLFLVEGDHAIVTSVFFGADTDRAEHFTRIGSAHPIPLGEMVVESDVLRRRKPTIVADAVNDPRTFRPLVEAADTRSYMVAPLIPEDRVIGFLHADCRFSNRALDDIDLEILGAYADSAAYVMEFSRTRQHLRAFAEQLDDALSHLALFSQDLTQVGAAMPTDEFWSNVGGGHPAGATPADFARLLSRRELEVIEQMSTGASNRQIATALVVTEGTVKSHVKHILRKLGAASRSEAVARYLRSGSQSQASDPST